MKVLVVGTGAREHALCLSLSRDPSVTALACAPGNVGIGEVAELLAVDPLDPPAVAHLARGFDLVVVGPEAPLVAGVADAVRAAGIPVFGPSGAAAQIEGSKTFAKQVMAAAGVPTAAADSCDSTDAAVRALGRRVPPYVVKADGLAAGKGVLVTEDLVAAESFARDALSTAGARVVIEDHLDGPEVSLFAITDGTTVLPLLPAQDHKRVGDGDTGPNTGGMGAYAPLAWLPAGTVEDVTTRVLEPVVAQMRAQGTPFSGLLYCGLAMTSRGPQVVEFNCRFGDPETQSVLALLETPLSKVLYACATGTLRDVTLSWRPGASVTVVVAAEGYPGAPTSGDAITIGALPDGVDVLHAGTGVDADGRVVATGGRVLSVTSVAPTLSEARESAYRGLEAIDVRGGFWRTDIAARATRGEITVPTQESP